MDSNSACDCIIWRRWCTGLVARAGYGFLALLAALFMTTLAADERASDPEELVLVGQVVRVTDGDTVRVELSSGEIIVRLDGIDAPESNQKFGAESTRALRQLVDGAQVELKPIVQDRYDRLVAVVFVNGANVNAQMILTGNAWAYRRYLRAPEFCRLEDEARKNGRGLWADVSRPWVAPWEFRQRRRLDRFSDYSSETQALCIAAIGN